MGGGISRIWNSLSGAMCSKWLHSASLNQNKSKQRQLFWVNAVGLWSQTQAQQLVPELNDGHLRCDIFHFLERKTGSAAKVN